MVATTGFDGIVRLMTVYPEDLLALVQTRVTRFPTVEECQRFLHMETCPAPWYCVDSLWQLGTHYYLLFGPLFTCACSLTQLVAQQPQGVEDHQDGAAFVQEDGRACYPIRLATL